MQLVLINNPQTYSVFSSSVCFSPRKFWQCDLLNVKNAWKPARVKNNWGIKRSVETFWSEACICSSFFFLVVQIAALKKNIFSQFRSLQQAELKNGESSVPAWFSWLIEQSQNGRMHHEVVLREDTKHLSVILCTTAWKTHPRNLYHVLMALHNARTQTVHKQW